METYGAGDGDKHKVLAGPDVQMVSVKLEVSVFIGKDLEFFPEGVDVYLLVVHPAMFRPHY